MKNIILVCGKKRAGKDTFFNILDIKHPERFSRMKFAAPMYETVNTAFGYEINDDNKETFDIRLNITPRKWMQEYGDMMKRICGPAIFASILAEQVDNTDAETIIVTDCRFQEEIDFMRQMFDNVISVLVKRDKVVSIDNHISERLDIKPDFIIENYGDLGDYADKVCDWYDKTIGGEPMKT